MTVPAPFRSPAWSLVAFLLPVCAWPETPPVNLDVPANSQAVEVLRRAQTRASRLLPAQAFPQRMGLVSDPSLEAVFTAHDRTQLGLWLPGLRPAPIRWNDSLRGHSLFLSPMAEAGFSRTSGAGGEEDMGGVGGVGLLGYGKAGRHLTFYTRGSVYTEQTNRDQFTHQFSPEYGESYTVEKGPGDTLLSARTFNRFEYYMRLDLPWIAFKAGRDRLHMGPGYFSSLTAGRDTPPYYLAEARIDFAPWLQVDNYLLRMTDTDHGIRKYGHLHRFEFKPRNDLSMAFQTMVIYQDRDVDFAYAIPLVPLAFAEDNSGARDNDAMSFDFLYAGLPGLSFWGELFIDDLLGPAAFFDDFWENRWATLAGFQAVSPWRAFDADLVAEFSRVEPWTYIGRQAQSGFKHFNAPSASKLGPDSRSLDIQLSWRPRPWLELKERFEANDKGLGRPGTLGLVHDDAIDGTSKEFLGGDVRRERLLRHAAVFRWRGMETRAYWTQSLYGDGKDGYGVQASALW